MKKFGCLPRPEVYSIRETAAVLNCSARQIYYLVERKVLRKNPYFAAPRFNREHVESIAKGLLDETQGGTK
jgi:hypothetical protein